MSKSCQCRMAFTTATVGSLEPMQGGDALQIHAGTDFAEQYFEALKALRTPKPIGWQIEPKLLSQFYAAGLVELVNGHHSLTPLGRRVVVAGSPKLWDVAA